MAKHRTTLKQIADHIGVTVTTVSKALKDYPDIGKEMKRRVREVAEELNYIPDMQATSLRSKKTYTIGLILPEVVHYFFSSSIKGITDYCEEKGYRLLITLSDNKTAMEAKQVKLFFSTRVDGVLVSLANQTEKADHFNLLKEYNVPVVMFDKIDKSFDCSKVVIDDEQGAYIATKHLIDKGCKRIAHIAGPQTASNAVLRKKGYIKALKEAGIEIDTALIKECTDVVFDEGKNFSKELLNMKNPPDGVFAVTDQIGVAVLHTAQNMGIAVPKDLKIVGFSDSQVSQLSNPALTTIHQSGYDIGKQAAEILINEIETEREEPSVAYQTVTLEAVLVERGTT